VSIELKNITKRFGTFTALDNVSLTVPDGELVALLGPSGSGKTTLLRIIAGLEAPDAGGQVLFEQKNVGQTSVRHRGVGFVFQHYALFRHMTVFENIAFGLRVRPRRNRPGKGEIRQRVMELLKLVQLENLAGRHPSQLSGGQRQRVALARALAVEPRVLLLDEPFGALDARVRKELRRWLRRLHEQIHVTSVFVTHDQEEALEVADQVVILNAGRIEQVGTPEQVYDKPASAFVLSFLGNVNLFHGRLDEQGRLDIGSIRDGESASSPQRAAVGYVRPHDIELARTRNGHPGIAIHVEHISPAGAFVRIYAMRDDNGEPVEVEISRDRYQQLALKPGDQLHASLREMRVFTDDYSI
jgi:sulfate/thiosulfate transport system ATP-binding protein